MKQCDDGYMSCRKAEATGEWCADKCAASSERIESISSREMRLALDAIIKKYPSAPSIDYGTDTIGNLRVRLGKP